MKQFLIVLAVLAVMAITTWVMIGDLPLFALDSLLDLGQFLDTLDPGVL